MRTILVASAVALAAWGAVVHARVFADYSFEDAFITFRYARNLAEGHGFVFSPGGAPVLGTSTPLWTLLLAGLGALGFDVATAGIALYAVSLSLAGLLAGELLRREGLPSAGAALVLAAVWGVGGALRYVGMETAFYVALIFAALVADQRRRPWTTGVLLGLVATTRYDGILPVGILLAAEWWRERRPPWRQALVAGSLTASWLVYALATFGGPFPNTLGAKAGDSGFLEYLAGAADLHLLLYVPVQRLVTSLPPRWVFEAATISFLALAAVGSPRLLRSRPSLGVLPLVAIALTLGYAMIGPPAGHRWYLLPATWCLLAFGLAAVEGLAPLSWRRRGLPAAVAFAILASFPLLLEGARREEAVLRTQPVYETRIGAYDDLAEWILDRGLEDRTLLTKEPGYLTYRTGQPAIDGAGLVTRGIYFHGPADRRTPLARILAQHRPELVVEGTTSGRPGPELDGWIPVRLGQPRKMLLLRRDVYRETFERSWELWQRPPDLGSRVLDSQDFETGAEGWRSFPIGEPPVAPASFLGLEEAGGHLLHSFRRGADLRLVLWSEPFRLEGDELGFDFLGTAGDRTVAQLWVEGLLAYEVRGGSSEELRRIRWPIREFRGRTGVLRFADSARAPDGFLAADRVGIRERGAELLAPLEALFPSAADRLPAKEVALRHGLVHGLGAEVATTLDRAGTVRLTSRPFELRHDVLGLTLHDLGSETARVELLAGDRVVLRGRLRPGAPLTGVIRDLSAWRGSELRLTLVDEDPAPERGLGMGSLIGFDVGG